jgi:hypothetical protein
MTYNITPAQGITESLNIQAAMWANRIMTRKITKGDCRAEVAKLYAIDKANNMEARIIKYVKAGLVTEAAFKAPAQEQIERIKQQAKTPPAQAQSTSGSSDGLWSTNVRGKR